MTTKIKRVLISILLASLFVLIIVGIVYVFGVYTEYVIVIAFIALPICVLAEAIYDTLSEH